MHIIISVAAGLILINASFRAVGELRIRFRNMLKGHRGGVFGNVENDANDIR